MSLIPPPDTTPSFERSAIPLLLALRPSRVYLATIVVVHALSIAAVLIATIAIWLQLALCALVLISLTINLRHHYRPVQIIWRTGNRWFINDSPDAAALHSLDFVSRWLIVLTLTQKNRRHQKVIIAFDALPDDIFRLLRVRLKIEGFAILNPSDDA